MDKQFWTPVYGYYRSEFLSMNDVKLFLMVALENDICRGTRKGRGNTVSMQVHCIGPDSSAWLERQPPQISESFGLKLSSDLMRD